MYVYTNVYLCTHIHIYITSCPAGHLRHRAYCVLRYCLPGVSTFISPAAGPKRRPWSVPGSARHCFTLLALESILRPKVEIGQGRAC